MATCRRSLLSVTVHSQNSNRPGQLKVPPELLAQVIAALKP